MMDSSEPQNLRQNSLEQLKSKLKKKLENIKSELHSLNTKLSNNIRAEGPKINSECNRHISDLKDKTLNYVKNKEKKIKEKEIISNVYFEAIRNVKMKEISIVGRMRDLFLEGMIFIFINIEKKT